MTIDPMPEPEGPEDERFVYGGDGGGGGGGARGCGGVRQ
jgi:hypothetical protein